MLTREEADVEENVVGSRDNAGLRDVVIAGMDDEHSPPQDGPVSQTENSQRYHNLDLTFPKSDSDS